MYSCYVWQHCVCPGSVCRDCWVCRWKVVAETDWRKFSIETDQLFLWFYEINVFASFFYKQDYDFKIVWIMIGAMLRFDKTVCHQLGQGY